MFKNQTCDVKSKLFCVQIHQFSNNVPLTFKKCPPDTRKEHAQLFIFRPKTDRECESAYAMSLAS